MIKKADFKLLDRGFFPLFKRFAEEFYTESCERSWGNLQLYMDTYRWHGAVCDDRLWIVSFDTAYSFFPLGKIITPGLLRDKLILFDQWCGKTCQCGDLPPDYLLSFPEAEQYLQIEQDPGEADYIYDLEHLHSFSGERLRKRHNQFRQFERAYDGDYSVSVLQNEDLVEVIDLAGKVSSLYWDTPSGMEEKSALSRLPEFWSNQECGLSGVKLQVHNSLIGFSIFSDLGNGLADIHFEKTDHTLRGSGAMLTFALTDYLLSKNFRFMNREQDLNETGLRRAKNALDPDHLYCRLSAEARLS